MKKLLIIFILIVTSSIIVNGQSIDSLKVEVGTIGTVASKNYLPLWLTANRFGVITDQQWDFATHVKASNSFTIGRSYNPIYEKVDRSIKVDYSVDLYNNSHFGKVVVPELFVKGRYRKIQVLAGRFKQIIGEVDPDLSSGSLGVSGNALPITKISIAIPAYMDVPFTNGFIQFKGHFANGWMGHDQYMKKALLHEKTLYGRIGKGKLKLYGGIQHYAVWGGYRADSYEGKALDKNFKGFINVLFGLEANDGSVPDSIRPNRPGDQRGVIEGGIEWENDAVRINLNHQTPFDQGLGIDIRNVDRLVSLNIINKREDAVLRKLVVEFIYTKQMNDFTPIVFRDSYYNNGVYKTGWEYHDHIVGTPLFINRVRGQHYFSDVKPFDWDAPGKSIPGLSNIISNRVVGGHVGFLLGLNSNLTSKTMVTITKNYGYFATANFIPAKMQSYSLEEVSWNIPGKSLSLTCGLAFDFGQLSKNFGSMIGLQWHLE
ncbi:MAG: hypothetical protein EOO85_13965 [Pedobacter sp.]|nr:MAG: hypothetical protein EOO85_13965 [Pedobacter sp.]